MPLDLPDKRASSDQPIAGGKPTSHFLIRRSGLDYFRVAIYTDGLTENFNSQREMLGVDGLKEILSEASTLPLGEMKSQILNRVAAWRNGPAADDVSLVLLEIS